MAHETAEAIFIARGSWALQTARAATAELMTSDADDVSLGEFGPANRAHL